MATAQQQEALSKGLQEYFKFLAENLSLMEEIVVESRQHILVVDITLDQIKKCAR